METTKHQATQYVVKTGAPQRRHLLDCDYFVLPNLLRKATAEEMNLPMCQWCMARMQAALDNAKVTV